jgi:hypothetical protein
MMTPYEEILLQAGIDREFHDYVIDSSEVSTEEDGIKRLEFRFEKCMVLCVRDELRAARGTDPRPDGLQKGDVLRVYGRLFGFVRGAALVEYGAVSAVFRYMTAAQAESQRQRENAERKERQRREWEEKKDETLSRVARMPERFQRRFEFFMRRPEWGPEFGLYEVFCMEEAIKIARICKTAERVAWFAKAAPAFQKGAADAADVKLSDDHSGNTFGAACHLAHGYLAETDSLFKFHGALCPLVGCKEYGCYASTVEQKDEHA